MIPRMLFLSLALPSAAFATPHLTVGGTCPGSLSVDVTGLTGGGPIAIITGSQAGVTVVPSGHCAGTEVRIDASSAGFRLFQMVASPSGGFSTGMLSTPSPCDRKLQVIDLTSCEVSNVWDRANPQCNAASTYIDDPSDVVSLSACQALGDLTIGTSGGGSPVGLATVQLPNLVHVESFSMNVANQVTGLSMPALRRAHRTVSLGQVTQLQQLQLPRLQETPSFSLGMNNQLNGLSLPALEQVETLDLWVYGDLSMPALELLTGNMFHGGDITRLLMPSLVYIGGQMESFTYPNLSAVDLGSLETVGHAWTSYEYVDFLDNPNLTLMDVHSLQEVSMFLVRNNAQLCTDDDTPVWPEWATVNTHVQTAIVGNKPGCFSYYDTP